MTNRILVQCPLCKKEDERVLFRPHWSNKYHEFICGHCRTELSFVLDPTITIEEQLKEVLDRRLVKLTGYTMEQSVKHIMDTMTEEEMLDRLDELNAVYN
jgi:hypothetical protein